MSQVTQPVTKVLISSNLSSQMPDLADQYPHIKFVEVPLEGGELVPEYLDAQVLFRSAMDESLFNEILESATELEWIQISAAGFDWMGGEIFDRRVAEGLQITRSANSYNAPMAEYVIGAILNVARKFPQLQRAQQARSWIRMVGTDFRGSTIGIFGTGAIGSEIAWRATALGANVLGVNRNGTPVEHFSKVVDRNSFEDILPRCDYVVLAMPLTPESHHMFGRKQFELMSPRTVIINVGRGALMNEEDLIEALESETIAGAVLDAFVDEPLPPDHQLWITKNAIITPHCSFRTEGIMSSLCDDFRRNLDLRLAGKALVGTKKDPVLGY